MKLVIVRIEDLDGHGPYRSNVDWGWDTPNAARHPTPFEDYGLHASWTALNAIREHELWSFGFKNAGQMLSWFDDDDWLVAMRRAGLRLTTWAVDQQDVHFGDSQVIFRRDRATMLSESPLIDDERYAKLTAESDTMEEVVPA